MRLEQLTYLIEVVSCKSMSKASVKLHVSQQNISKTLKNLEEELGFTLLDRAAKGILLTEQGEEVYYLALETLEKIRAIERLAPPKNTSNDYENLRGALQLTVSPGISKALFNSMLTFKSLCPKVVMRIDEREMLDVVYQMQWYNSELGLTTLDEELAFLPNGFLEQYDLELIRSDTLKLLINSRSKLLSYQKISDKILHGLPLVIFATNNERKTLCEELLFKNKIKANTVLTTNSHSLYSELITRGEVAGLCNDFVYQVMVHDSNINMLTLPLQKRIGLVHILIRKKQLSKPAEVFYKYFVNSFTLYGRQFSPYTIPTATED